MWIHEEGHLLAARLLGIPLRRGSGGAFGIRLTFDFSRQGYGREAAVHLAGPLAGIAAAALTAGIREDFAAVNAGLALVNLLPLEGFDGGGILRCLLLGRCGPSSAERAARAVSWAARCGMWLLAVRLALLPDPDAGLLFFAAGDLCRMLNQRE